MGAPAGGLFTMKAKGADSERCQGQGFRPPEVPCGAGPCRRREGATRFARPLLSACHPPSRLSFRESFDHLAPRKPDRNSPPSPYCKPVRRPSGSPLQPLGAGLRDWPKNPRRQEDHRQLWLQRLRGFRFDPSRGGRAGRRTLHDESEGGRFGKMSGAGLSASRSTMRGGSLQAEGRGHSLRSAPSLRLPPAVPPVISGKLRPSGPSKA